MDTNIEVRYKQLPFEIIEDFKKNIERSSISITVIHDKYQYYNATGGPADIIIYIDQHLTELIVGGVSGLVVNGVYDSIKTIWKKLQAYYSTQQTEIQEDKNYISLNFKLKPDRTLKYSLEGTVDEKIIINLTENIFKYLKDTEKQNKDFQNPDFKDKDDLKPKIRMRYNPKTNSWNPVNFAEFEKWRDEQIRQAEEKYDG